MTTSANYALGKADEDVEYVDVKAQDGVRYALPQRISKGNGKVRIFFRVDNVYRKCKLVVECGEEQLFSKKFMVLAPGEMGSVEVNKSAVNGDVVVRLEV